MWHALELDPNQENGLGWYTSIFRERDGDEAERAAWQRVSALPQSWCAQLWRARDALQSGDTQKALGLYRESLSRAGETIPPTLLLQLSADLGKRGMLTELLQLTEPMFVPEKHGLQVGNNLIKAHLELSHLDDASRILNQLFALKRPGWKKQLSFWDTEIAKARNLRAIPPMGAIPKIEMLMTDAPVWLNASSPARHLFPGKPADSPVVHLLGSTADKPGSSDSAQYQLADAPGRLSRMLPLFLAEQIEFRTAASPRILVPWVAENIGGFVLRGLAWSDEEAISYAKQADAQSQYVVSIHLSMATSDLPEVRLRLLRVMDGESIGHCSVAIPISSRRRGFGN